MTGLVFLFFSSLISTNLWASAPAQQRITLAPLEVSWSAELPIIKLGWEGDQSQGIAGKKTISLLRNKYPSQKLHLVVVLKDREMAPLRIEIPDNQNKIQISSESFKKVSVDEIWLFGETPKSQCGGFSSFHLRFLNKKSIYTNFAGLFAWKVSKKDLPQDAVLYLAPQLELDTPKVVLSKAFARANERSLAQCHRHYGGTCPFVFNLIPPETGRTFLIHFKGLKERSEIKMTMCPV